MGQILCFRAFYGKHVELMAFGGELLVYASENLPSLIQIMACRLVSAKLLPEPMLEC